MLTLIFSVKIDNRNQRLINSSIFITIPTLKMRVEHQLKRHLKSIFVLNLKQNLNFSKQFFALR